MLSDLLENLLDGATFVDIVTSWRALVFLAAVGLAIVGFYIDAPLNLWLWSVSGVLFLFWAWSLTWRER